MSIFELFKKDNSEANRKEVENASLTLYQIQEYGGEIWLTYNGNLICPCSMLNEDPVKAIGVMREMYVARTPKLPRVL